MIDTQPSPLLAVPNVTAHPSTANLPTSYYSIWHYSCLYRVNTSSICTRRHGSWVETAQMYLTRSRSVLLLVNDMLGRLHNNSIGLQRDVIDDCIQTTAESTTGRQVLHWSAECSYSDLAALRISDVHLFVRPFVRSFVCRQNTYTKTRFSRKLSTLQL